MLVMTAFGLMLGLPTGSYVIYYPLIGYLIIQLILLGFDINAENKPVPYAIGQYVSNGNSFRVWIRVKNTDGQFRIHEMSFTPE